MITHNPRTGKEWRGWWDLLKWNCRLTWSNTLIYGIPGWLFGLHSWRSLWFSIWLMALGVFLAEPGWRKWYPVLWIVTEAILGFLMRASNDPYPWPVFLLWLISFIATAWADGQKRIRELQNPQEAWR